VSRNVEMSVNSFKISDTTPLQVQKIKTKAALFKHPCFMLLIIDINSEQKIIFSLITWVIIVIYIAEMCLLLINDAEGDRINLTSTPFYISSTDLLTH
jgi:hypothetical protein